MIKPAAASFALVLAACSSSPAHDRQKAAKDYEKAGRAALGSQSADFTGTVLQQEGQRLCSNLRTQLLPDQAEAEIATATFPIEVARRIYVPAVTYLCPDQSQP